MEARDEQAQRELLAKYKGLTNELRNQPAFKHLKQLSKEAMPNMPDVMYDYAIASYLFLDPEYFETDEFKAAAAAGEAHAAAKRKFVLEEDGDDAAIAPALPEQRQPADGAAA
jgi:hypothetical protein